MKEWIFGVIFAGLFAVGGLVSRFVFKKKPDNFIEEFSEQVIKNQTGYNVDLSPFSSPDPDGFNVIDVSNTLKKKEKDPEKSN